MSAVRSGLFSLTGATYKVIIGLVGLAFFARYVAPAQHGIYEFVLAIHTIALPFLDFGLLPAYLKIDKVNKEVNSVFFTLNVFIGMIITLLLIIAAPIIGYWQKLPEMTWYILAYAFIVFVISLGSQPSSQLIKQKRFKEIAIIDIIASTVALILGVVFALWDWAVWALLLRFIIDVFVKTSLQFIRVKPNYSRVNMVTIRKYWKSVVFGAEISINRIITGMTNATDRFLVKSFYGQGAGVAEFSVLGQYGKAVNVTSKADLIRNALTTPALSYLTALGTDHSRKYYFPVTQIFFFATALPILFFYVYGDIIVIWLMGSDWVEAGNYARVLAFYGAGLVLRGLVNIFHINEFKSKRLYRLNLVFFFSLYSVLIGLYLLLGIHIILFVQVLSIYTFSYWLLALMYSLYRFTGRTTSTFRTLTNVLTVASVFVGSGIVLRRILQIEFQLLEAIMVGAISLLAAILFFMIFDNNGFREQFQLIHSRIKKDS